MYLVFFLFNFRHINISNTSVYILAVCVFCAGVWKIE